MHLSAAFDEEAVCHLHDVCLVNRTDFLAAVVLSILEGILCHAGAGNPCDDLKNKAALDM